MKAEPNIEQAPGKAAQRAAIWSIGIFGGPTLSDLRPAPEIAMPVLAAKDVTDVRAVFVADPFMILANDTWHMFFEVMNADTRNGDIGLATSRNGLEWDYQRIVLSEPFHLSYPYVFCAGGEHFMIPETYEANSMRLYRADPFPLKWSYVGTLLKGPWVDSSIFYFDDRWWVFSSPVEPEHQVLELFHAFNPAGPWHKHSMSPLVQGTKRMARSAGRVIILDGKPVRFAQDCFPVYGTRVRAFEVSVLTASSYVERELERSPILCSGQEFWRDQGMHHIDPHFVNGQWLAAVDGWRFEDRNPQV
jgi:hypothetical protein